MLQMSLSEANDFVRAKNHVGKQPLLRCHWYHNTNYILKYNKQPLELKSLEPCTLKLEEI